jgi:tRNA(His) 5'-end guanylyltransferase
MKTMPMFDCRVWVVPNLTEAANSVLWRVQDAIRNSISMAAQAHFPHRELQGRDQDTMLAMLADKGVHWDKYPDFFKWGYLIRRHKVLRPFSPGEIEALPPQHHARRDPSLVIERTEVQVLQTCFKFIQNRTEFMLGAEPQLEETP